MAHSIQEFGTDHISPLFVVLEQGAPEVRLCRIYCSTDVANEFNELMFLDDDAKNAVCVLGLYTSMIDFWLRYLEMDSDYFTAKFTMATYNFLLSIEQPGGRRLQSISWGRAVATRSTSSASAEADSKGMVPQVFARKNNGTACVRHMDCMAMTPNVTCYMEEHDAWGPTLCASCPGRDASGNLLARCEAETMTCICGAGSETRPEFVEFKTSPKMGWDSYEDFMKPSEWRGASFCDALMTGMMDKIQFAPHNLTVLEGLEARRCMDLRAYGFMARYALGIHSLPLSLFYDVDAMYRTARNVALGVYVAAALPRGATADDVYVKFRDLTVDPIIGTRIYNAIHESVAGFMETFRASEFLRAAARCDPALPPPSHTHARTHTHAR